MEKLYCGTEIPVIISTKKLNLISVPVCLGLLLLSGALLVLRTPGAQVSFDFDWRLLVFMFAFLLLIPVHELVHGICYKLLGHTETKYSVDFKKMVVLAAAQSPMAINAYRWSAAMPTLVMALPLYIAGLAAGSLGLTMMGALLMASGVGDIAILLALRKYPATARAYDHPSDGVSRP